MSDLSPPIYAADLRSLSAGLIKTLLRSMARTADDSTLKECVMVAREHGHLTDEETGFYLSAWGLKNA